MKTSLIRKSSFAGILAALLLAGCGGEASPDIEPAQQQQQTGEQQSQDISALPALASLPAGDGLPRSVSAQPQLLLERAPVASSGPSAVWSPGNLLLEPADGQGMAWAIFELFEFPTDGSVVPQQISSSPASGYWLAFSEYSTARWDLKRAQTAAHSLSSDSSWISESGSFYVAVIAFNSAAEISGLTVETSQPLINEGLDEKEDNDQYTAPSPLPAIPFVDFRGSVGPEGYDGDKVDFLTFQAGEAEQVEISLEYDDSTATVELALLKPGSQSLLAEDAAGNPGIRQISAGLKAGTYVLRVEASLGSSIYTLGISSSPAQVDELEDNDTQLQANPIAADPESSIRGDIGSGGYDGDNLDYFVVDAQKGEQLTANLSYDKTRVNAQLYFRNGAGQQIADDDAGNPGLRSLSLGLHEGLNYVLVEAESGGGDYVLDIARSPGSYSESENNDNFASANSLGELPLNGWSGNVGETGYDGDERDYFVLTTAEGELLSLNLQYDETLGNLKLVLINPDQSTAYSDQTGNPGSRSFNWGARGGNSYVLVEAVSGTSDYELSISSSFPGYDEQEPNDNTGTAFVLPALPVSGFLGSIGQFGYDGDNADFYSFSVADGELVSFELSYDPLDANVFIELQSGSGSRIYLDDSGNSGSRIFNWGLKAGSYFVKISGNGDPADYLLGLSSTLPGYDEQEDNDDRINAKPLPAPPFTEFLGHVGQFGYNGDLNDYHFFNLAESTDLQFEMDYSELSGDLALFLLNEEGQVIDQDSVGNPGSRQVAALLPAGTFYLRVQARSGQSDYTLEAAAP